MQDTELYRQLLNLEPPWQIDGVVMDAKSESITITVGLARATRLCCPSCGRAECMIKDRRERVWRHLDTCQFKTLIRAPQPRVECPACGVKTAAVPWASAHSRFTLLFERLAIAALREMSIEGASRLLRISWDEADAIIGRAVKRGLEQRDLSHLRRIGIDEKSYRRGHRYLTVVYDLDGGNVIWIDEDRKEETLDRFFSTLPEELLGQIECLTMDMWEPFRASVIKWIEDAEDKTVLDHFHLTRHLNQAVDTVRKEEHRELAAQGHDLLAKSKYDWLYHPENLPPKREARFKLLRQYDLKTVRAHAIKESFRHFWNYIYPGNAERFFQDWYYWATHSRLAPIIKVAKQFKKHLSRIMTYFKYRISNSMAEGINNKIQTISKKSSGFRNAQRLINSIYFHCGGLNLNPL